MFDPLTDTFAVVGLGPRPGESAVDHHNRAIPLHARRILDFAGTPWKSGTGTYKGEHEPVVILTGPRSHAIAGFLLRELDQESIFCGHKGTGILLYDSGRIENLGTIVAGANPDGDGTAWEGGQFHC